MRILLVLAFMLTPLFAEELSFRAHLIEAEIPAGYQTLVADLNNDGKPDVIGLSGRAEELYWYESPSWQRRALIDGVHRMISLDAADLDGDGFPEVALGTHFGQTSETSEGRVYLLRSGGDPNKLWQAEEIDRLPTTHRLRFADLNGDGRVELINSALNGSAARGPLFEDKTPLVFYRVGEWKRVYASQAIDGVTHGARPFDWDGDGAAEILTASFGGVELHRRNGEGWTSTLLTKGDPTPRPKGGASEISVGRLGAERFLATMEPWHGHQVVVYSQDGAEWKRQVLDDSIEDGHVVETADFDGDGNDEILAGFRGEASNLYLYRREGARWIRQTLDEGGMAAAGCDLGDLNSDGRTDIVCIGARTANIKWYENLNPQ